MEETLKHGVNFPELIGQLRTNVGMTQAEASRRSGVAPDAWSRIERADGDTTQITLRRALQMISGLGWKITLTLDNDKNS